MSEGEVVCHREEEVQVQAVRVAEAVVHAVGAARQAEDGVVRLIAALIDVLTVAVGVHLRFLPEGSGGISLQGFRRI